METIAVVASALDEKHIRTALGKSVLAEYGNGTGPLAVTDAEVARQRFAAAALAEMAELINENQQEQVSV